MGCAVRLHEHFFNVNTPSLFIFVVKTHHLTVVRFSFVDAPSLRV